MFDYVIIGAGPSGLCAAKTILQCKPLANLRILDAGSSVGGVWRKEKLYSGLKTNNRYGSLDFTDFPMTEDFGVKSEQHVPGHVMHDYLVAYAQHWDLFERIDFDTTVSAVSKLPEKTGWKITVTAKETVEIRTSKLIVATGVTNEPHRPLLKGADDFCGRIYHSAALGRICETFTADDQIQRIAVLGGGKSAYDAVYLAASSGREVEWIIRKSGKGPAWVFPSQTKIGPFTAWREKLTTTRLVSCMSPCIWSDGLNLIRSFLHGTSLGMMISQKFWANVGAATLADCGYAKDKVLNVLQPETSPFWYGTASGVLVYETDIFDFVRSGQVRIHREDISHLSKEFIHLEGGQRLDVQALVTATGYSAKPTVHFSPTSLHSDLGIPSTSLTDTQQNFWDDLGRQADFEIGSRFPRLLFGPFQGPTSKVVLQYNDGLDPDLQYSPFRLYRGIAPPGLTTNGDHSIAFIGMFSNIANTLRLELQCLWAYAYLSEKLPIRRETVFEEAALMSQYVAHRSPFGHGRHFPDLVFDQMPYFDMLLQDLGLPYWRKTNILKELFQPYGQADYRGVVHQWLEKIHAEDNGT